MGMGQPDPMPQPGISEALNLRINAMEDRGKPMDEATRSFFEVRFGRDFGHVRVHDTEKAAEISHAIQARAFTIGSDIVFGSGMYSPETNEGKHLLGHELVHTLQQNDGNTIRLQPSNPESPGLMDRNRTYRNYEVNDGRASWTVGEVDPTTGEMVYDQAGNGLDMYGPEAQMKGIVPDPNDIYAQEPMNNWEGLPPAEGPEIPLDWSPALTSPPDPFPTIITRPSSPLIDPGSTIPVQSSQIAFAHQCVDTWKNALALVTGTWNAMKAQIQKCVTAGSDPVFQEGGLNWLENKGEVEKRSGSNIRDLAGGEGVGREGRTTVDEITANPAVNNGSLENGGKPTKAMEDAAGEVQRAHTAIEDSVGRASDHLASITDLKLGVENALRTIQINQLEGKEEENRKETAALETRKANAINTVSGVFKAVYIGVEAYKGIMGIAKPIPDPTNAIAFTMKYSAELIEYVTKNVVASDYDKQIAAKTSELAAIESEIKSIDQTIDVSALTMARNAVERSVAELPRMKNDVVRAMGALEEKYRVFAEVCGSAVGGEKGEWVRAAIEAIPKVQTALGYAASVADAFSLPGYTREAGIGQRAVGPDDLGQRVSFLYGYLQKYYREAADWGDKLAKLQRIAQSYGLGN
jgi:hypothetical protein